MRVTIYGKPNCKPCEAAKAKMALIGVPYLFRDLDDVDHWREDSRGIVAARAEYEMSETLPIFAVDGTCMSYPAAMRMLRGR